MRGNCYAAIQPGKQIRKKIGRLSENAMLAVLLGLAFVFDIP
jgi:hypothetical protein